MYNKKHMMKSKVKNKGVYFLILALIITILCITRSVYNIQVATIKAVDKLADFSTDNQNKTGKVIIKYIDSEGNEIATSETISGQVGEEYSTSRKKIDGYKRYGNDPINKVGNYDDLDIEVTYVYEKIGNEVKTSTDGNTVTVQVIKNQEQVNQEVKLSIITENENGEKIKGAKYIVTDNNSAVIRNSTAYAEKLLVGSITINQEGTDVYNIRELSAPNGYENIKDKIGVQIVKTYKNDLNTYAISANLAEQNSNVDIQYNENDGEIIVTIKNTKKQEEVKPITKTFDLEINKSISEVKLNVDGKTKVEKAEGNKLLKIDIPKSKINSSSAEITYKIEVKNIGELPGYVSELTDIIPENMELIESEDWNLDEKIALSNTFEGEILNPGESFVTYITFNWNFNEENIGLKTNKAVISGYFNDYGISDNTPSNESEAPILVTVKTGGKVLITIEVVVALAIICGIVYIIKKRKN